MTTKPNDFKIGLFVLAGLGLLLAGLFLFGASRFFEGKTVEETYVKEGVEGLKVGAPVLLRGVPVGEVTRINFSWNVYHVAEPRYVVVEFEVGNKVALVPPGRQYAERVQKEVANGLRARIKSQGLAGATIVSLEYLNPAEHPPMRVPWTPHRVYIPSAPGQFTEIISAFNAISGQMKEINFQQIGTQVQKDLAAMERILNHVDQVNLAGLSGNLNGLLTDLRGVSTRLQSFVGGAANQPSTANLPAISSETSQVLTRLNATIGKLDQMLANLNESSLNQSLENLRRVSQELEQTVHQIQQYPSGALLG